MSRWNGNRARDWFLARTLRQNGGNLGGKLRQDLGPIFLPLHHTFSFFYPPLFLLLEIFFRNKRKREFNWELFNVGRILCITPLALSSHLPLSLFFSLPSIFLFFNYFAFLCILSKLFLSIPRLRTPLNLFLKYQRLK